MNSTNIDTIEAYKDTPPHILKIIAMFRSAGLSYILFKCDHIFNGKNKNLDILLETDIDFRQARKLLCQTGFILRLPESIEKYKEMWAGFVDENICSVHLHREIAWHGLKALDKIPVFERAKTINQLINVPSLEDNILIHAGHVLFENFKITEKEQFFFDLFKNSNVDKKYIFYQLNKNHWKLGFKRIIYGKIILSVLEIVDSWISKLVFEPATSIYLTKKIIKALLRKCLIKRRGCLIALIGINGCGKSTISRKLLAAYKPITTHLGVKQYGYYYGWNPKCMITKWLSFINQKAKLNTFSNQVFKKQARTIDLIQELSFLYQWFEYCYRYWKDIRPKLVSGNLVVTDRYFYDIWGQYPYGRRSIVLPLLIKLFPSPTITYWLDAPLPELQVRRKTGRLSSEILETERQVMPIGYLQQQCHNYFLLNKKLPIKRLDNSEHSDSGKAMKSIINDTWRYLL